MKLKRSKTKGVAWGKYWAICALAFKERLHYPKRVQAIVLVNIFRVIMMLLIYSYAFKYLGRDINGIDARTAVWSIAVYFFLLSGQFRFVFKTINDDVRNGELETQLNKPYDYLAYKFWERLGKGMLSFVASGVAMLPVLLILTGGLPAHLSGGRLLAGLLLAIGGTLVSAAIYILIVLPALWIEDATPLFWIADKAVLILGGSYVPLALLPESFQAVARLTPFGAPMFATQMFNPAFTSHLPQFFLMQVFWIVALSLLIRWVFERARKKLSVNGG